MFLLNSKLFYAYFGSDFNFLLMFMAGTGVPTGYGALSLAAVIDFIPDVTGIALRNGIAASLSGP